MERQRRSFTEEYKRQAVELVLSGGMYDRPCHLRQIAPSRSSLRSPDMALSRYHA